jgi:hypothetical protein
MWKRHPELAVFVNDNGTVTSERRYMAAINEDRKRDGLSPISVATVIQTGMQPIYTEPKLLKPFLNRQRKGYLFIKTAEGQTRALHKIVAEVYIPNPQNKPQVNHKDGDKSNNCANNLEWVSISTNTKHAFENNLGGFRDSALRNLEKMNSNRYKKVLLEKDGQIITFNSTNEASIFLKTNKDNISRAFKKGQRCKGYKVICKRDC